MNAKILTAIGSAILLSALVVAQDAKRKCDDCGGRGKVQCTRCGGKFAKVTSEVDCLKKDGGCDKKGYRQCHRCGGKAEIKCKRCSGDGRVTKKVPVSGGALFTAKQTVGGDCPECAMPGAKHPGWKDCEDCRTLWICTRCNRTFPSEVSFCSTCTPPLMVNGNACAPQSPTTIRKQDGLQVCPKCDGKGTYVKQGKCPDCDRGDAKCGACSGKGWL